MTRNTIGHRIAAMLCCGGAAVAFAAAPPSSAPPRPSVPAELIRFHGHDECPGLTMGYRMASEAMKAVPAGTKLIAVAENRTCGVDGLQWVTGCTAGKANLRLKDYGKHAYSLYSAETKKGVRVLLDRNRIPANVRKDRSEFIKWILTADANAFLTIQPVELDEPDVARTRESTPCAVCGEAVSLTRLREPDGKKMCFPCAEKTPAKAR